MTGNDLREVWNLPWRQPCGPSVSIPRVSNARGHAPSQFDAASANHISSQRTTRELVTCLVAVTKCVAKTATWRKCSQRLAVEGDTVCHDWTVIRQQGQLLISHLLLHSREAWTLAFSSLTAFCFVFWDRVSLCNSIGCSGTCSVDQAVLELTEIHLLLPPECWD